METKKVLKYIDHGFGFPVELCNVTMIKVRGKWTLQVNYNQLAKRVLVSLAEFDGRLTGNQVKFIRQHFEMTLQQFAARLEVTHAAVKKWENAENEQTGMSWTTEKDIRLFTKQQSQPKPKEFLYFYNRLESVPSRRPIKLSLAW